MRLDPEIESLFASQPILAALPRAQWRVSVLGGLTNRSYRLQGGGHDLVLRWPGESASRYLDRSAESGNAAAVAKLGLAPAVLAADPGRGWYITEFETGATALTCDDFAQAKVFAEVAGVLGLLHRAAIRFPFQQGLFQAIDLYLVLAPTPLMIGLRRRLDPVQAALQRHPGPRVPSHIDPNPANFLRRRDGSLCLIDWEFAAMEEPLWDLAAIALEASIEVGVERAVIEPLIRAGEWPRFELYKTALLLVAASWCEMELAAGNAAPDLINLRDDRVRRLLDRLADPRHATWLAEA
jgi:thiamine kinase-like enzyme